MVDQDNDQSFKLDAPATRGSDGSSAQDSGPLVLGGSGDCWHSPMA